MIAGQESFDQLRPIAYPQTGKEKKHNFFDFSFLLSKKSLSV
jgi:hypothetical protein